MVCWVLRSFVNFRAVGPLPVEWWVSIIRSSVVGFVSFRWCCRFRFPCFEDAVVLSRAVYAGDDSPPTLCC